MTLKLELERLMVGANASVELGHASVPEWLAGELEKLYPRYEATKDVRVTCKDAKVIVERPDGMPRVLQIEAAKRQWELAASATGPMNSQRAVELPGQIAAILQDP